MEDQTTGKGVEDLGKILIFLLIGSLGVLFSFLIVALILFRFFPKLFYKKPRFKLQRFGKTMFFGSLIATVISSLFCYVSTEAFVIPVFFHQSIHVPRAFLFVTISFQTMGVGAIFWRTGGRVFRSSQGSKVIPFDLEAKLLTDDFSEIESLSKISKDAPIGVSLLDGKPVQYLFEQRNYHMMVVGGSGFGKTTLMKTLFAHAIYQKQPVIMIDPKGSSDNLNEIRKFALTQGVPEERFFVFSLPHPEMSSYYNPLKNADTTAKKDRIMESFNWSEQYYQSRASDYLTLLIPVLELFKLGDVTLRDVRKSLTEPKFLDRIQAVMSEIAMDSGVDLELKLHCNEAAKQIEALKKLDGTEGLKSQLVTLEQSDFGYLFSPEQPGATTLADIWKESKREMLSSEDKKSNLSEKGKRLQMVLKDKSFIKEKTNQLDKREIDLAQLIEQGGFVYFQISMMQTPDTARRIARVILEDLKGVANRIQTHQVKKPSLLPVFIDEFGEFATEEFGVFLEQVRDAQFALHLFFQSFGNLEAVSPTFRKRMEASTAEKIFLSTLSPEDAENAAQLCGTDDAVEYSRQTFGLLGWSIPTGMGNQRFTKQMRVEHDVFKRLKVGQAVTLRKFPESKVDLVQIWNPDLIGKNQTALLQKEQEFQKHTRLKKLSDAGTGHFKRYRAWSVPN